MSVTRHQEFPRFLRRTNREFSGKAPLHLVMDNCGTHGTPEVKDWLNRHPRFKAINEFLAAWNEKPRPFVWRATVESMVGKLARCRQTPEQIQPGCTRPVSRSRADL